MGSHAANNVLVNLDDNVVCESTYAEITKGGIWWRVYPNPSGTILAVLEGNRLAFYDLRVLRGSPVPRKEHEFLYFTGERYLSPWVVMPVVDPFDDECHPLDLVESEWNTIEGGGSHWMDDAHIELVAPAMCRVVYEVRADGMYMIVDERGVD